MHDDTKPMPEEWSRWVESLRWHLDLVPGLLEAMRAARIPSAAAQMGAERVSGSGANGSPAPLRVEATDDGDLLWRELGELLDIIDRWFEGEQADRYGAELVARIATRADRAETTARGEMSPNLTATEARLRGYEITNAILDRAEQIADRPALRDACETLFTTLRRLRARYAPEAKRARRRRCTTCGEVAVVCEWAVLVTRTVARGYATCTECGQEYMEELWTRPDS